jgi:hypothetical protein
MHVVEQLSERASPKVRLTQRPGIEPSSIIPFTTFSNSYTIERKPWVISCSILTLVGVIGQVVLADFPIEVTGWLVLPSSLGIFCVQVKHDNKQGLVVD